MSGGPFPVYVNTVERGPTGLSAFALWRIQQGNPALTPQDFYNYLASLASGSGSSAQQRFVLTAVGSYVANHGISGRPPAVLLNAAGRQVYTDLDYRDGSVSLSFPQPFTGTLFVG
jgi:hypothetical protein